MKYTDFSSPHGLCWVLLFGWVGFIFVVVVYFLFFVFWSGDLLIASVIHDGARCHARPLTHLPTLESLSVYPEVLKPPRLHLRLTELRNLGKFFAGRCIEECFSTNSLPALHL